MCRNSSVDPLQMPQVVPEFVVELLGEARVHTSTDLPVVTSGLRESNGKEPSALHTAPRRSRASWACSMPGPLGDPHGVPAGLRSVDHCVSGCMPPFRGRRCVAHHPAGNVHSPRRAGPRRRRSGARGWIRKVPASIQMRCRATVIACCRWCCTIRRRESAPPSDCTLVGSVDRDVVAGQRVWPAPSRLRSQFSAARALQGLLEAALRSRRRGPSTFA